MTRRHGQPRLSALPGRIAPTDPAWTDSRKPLVGQFTCPGRTFLVIADHFVSQGGDDPLFGRYQPPSTPSQKQRHEQATLVYSSVQRIEQVDLQADVVVLGDLNDSDFSTTADILVGDHDPQVVRLTLRRR